MASIRKHPRSPFWLACYRTSDGAQRTKSTGLLATGAFKVRALRIAESLEKAKRDIKTLAHLRKLVAEVAEETTEEARQPATVKECCNAWLDAKKRGVAATTLAFYKIAITRFLGWLGKDGDRDMMGMTRRRLELYRAHLADTLTPRTANHNMKVMKMVFRRARLDGVTMADAAEGVETVKMPREERRRAFTLEELRAVLTVAEGEWRGLVLFGLYSGQRLGDLARLTWENVDLAADGGNGQLRLVTGKTGRSQFIPLHTALRDYLAGLEVSDNPQAFLFPRAAAAVAATGGKTGTLSNQFANILAAAGLRDKASHEAKREGRDQILARVYGVATLTLQRWITAGDAAKDPCPVAQPAQMAAWWDRVMTRRPARGILEAAAKFPHGIPDLPQESIRRGGAGLKKDTVRVSFHSLRHTATSLLKAAGVSASVVMDLIGHDDAAMSQHYTHTGDSERRRAVDALPSL